MKKLGERATYFLRKRPLGFLSTVFACRDFVIGFALFFSLSDLTRSILYANLNDLGGAWIYGSILMVIAMVTGFAALTDRDSMTRIGLQASSWFWLFACFSYLVNGNYVLALVFGFLASVPSGYLAAYYKHAV